MNLSIINDNQEEFYLQNNNSFCQQNGGVVINEQFYGNTNISNTTVNLSGTITDGEYTTLQQIEYNTNTLFKMKLDLSNVSNMNNFDIVIKYGNLPNIDTTISIPEGWYIIVEWNGVRSIFNISSGSYTTVQIASLLATFISETYSVTASYVKSNHYRIRMSINGNSAPPGLKLYPGNTTFLLDGNFMLRPSIDVSKEITYNINPFNLHELSFDTNMIFNDTEGTFAGLLITSQGNSCSYSGQMEFINFI